MKILLKNISKLLLTDNQSDKVVGADMKDLDQIENAYLIITDDVIEEYGRMSDLQEMTADEIIDVKGKIVLPAWCDSHTHIVFAATREGEFVDKIKGLSYEEIARKGGGILNSAAKLRNTCGGRTVRIRNGTGL